MKLESNLPKGREFSPKTGSRLRKKHKRLDAICENVYNRNHSSGSNEVKPDSEPECTVDDSTELRRSSRVRRAPAVLDASPPPVKRRKKIGKNVKLNTVNRNYGIDKRSVDEEVKSDKLGFLDTTGSWGWRLRSRDRNSVRRREAGETSRKRKLFDDIVETIRNDKGEKEIKEEEEEEKQKEKEEDDEEEEEEEEEEEGEEEEEVGGGGEEEEEEEEEEEREGEEEEEKEEEEEEEEEKVEWDDDEKLMVLISKRPGRVKAVNGLGNEMKKNEGHLSGKDEILPVENGVKEERTVLGGEMDGGNDVELVQDEVEEIVPVLVDAIDGETEKEDVNVDAVKLGSDEPEEKGRNIDGIHNVENMKESDKEVEELDTRLDEEIEGKVVEVDETLRNAGDDLNKEGNVEVNETPLEVKNAENAENSRHDTSTLGRPRVKQGRRCGLCGCANDGKPPKRLMQDAGESENEAYSGSSASEEPNYDVWDGFGDEPGWLGGLLGPINDRYGIAGIWVHQNCAVWSPEVYFAGLGCLKNVRAALCRGKALKCTRCGRPGATIGCRVDRCPKTYHLPCARANGCIFDHRKFLIACTDHRHLFQPYGNKYLMRIKKLKTRKMKLEIRKQSNDLWRKDVEAEEKWLENCGEDEEFLKRESKRLHRDLLRITPVYIGGSDSGSVKLFEGWESVAGLKDVIQCMKEVVILPLLYPEFFNNLGITPPRGVLLHGYPGTGKTLVVRALIGSCARGDKRIAYFARKGADCLGKYVGDAERQLRLLFQVAEKSQPSIIFFDEIDGLAPCRSRQQDQTHSSVVSTLLALMDGLKSRGSVVVIGATNRPEAVDPALRRPGRFDREIYFPLPSIDDRAAILSLHTQRWPKPVAGSLLQWVARRTVGFAGADLQALCTQAAIIALKRNFPLHAMLSAAGDKAPGAKLVPLPAFTVEERDWLEALACAPPPCSRREAGMAAHDLVTSPLPSNLIPCLLKPLSKLLVSLYLDERLLLPPPLSKAAAMVKSVIISTLEKNNIASNQWWFHVDSLLNETEVAKEILQGLSFAGIVEDFSCPPAYPDESTNDCFKFETSVQYQGPHINLNWGISSASRKRSGYRILVAGSPRSGQKHIASCILHCFQGNVEVQKVDLATISQEGLDVIEGITRLLMKCSSVSSSVIFMPRIDLWAVETCQQVAEEKDTSSTDQNSGEKEGCSTPVQDVAKQIVNNNGMFENIGSGRSHSESSASKKTKSSSSLVLVEKRDESAMNQCKEFEVEEPQNATLTASHAWCSFVEQLEYISVSTSLIILATSELPYSELPDEVKQFFDGYSSQGSEVTCMEHRVPRFMVNVAENFSSDVVVSLSTEKLLRGITQLFVSLVHQKSHIHATSSVDHKFFDSIQACHNTASHKKNDGLVVENDHKKECPGDNPKVMPPPSNRSLKGKSNLLLAISTFGYQILRFPHFAELCWVTSKLKEGPCADVSGPWKGWPFNSCIIYPAKVDNVPGTCSVEHIKSKEQYGLVRGLVAVGLSAYRGVYKSLREVSFEVRKVLELLVGQVNENIQAGKDRYQYVRLLSQVAYLEDMVNSWAHALQSLEPDNQIKEASQNTSEFPHDHASVDISIQGEDCRVLPDKSADDAECPEDNPVKFVPENVELNGEANGICHSGAFDRVVLSEDMSGKQIVHGGHSNLDDNYGSPISDDKLVDNKTDGENGTTLGQCEPENSGTPHATELDDGVLNCSNGFQVTEVINPGDGLYNLNEICIKSSSPLKSSDQVDRMIATEEGDKCNENIHSSPDKDASHSANSGVVCSYVCCSRCLCILHRKIQEMVVRRWELNSSSTADEIHDVVSSLSVDLLSVIRKADVTSNSIPRNVSFGNPETSSECSELQNCHCESWERSSDMEAYCCCHSAEGNSQPEMELEFVFRDGILVPLDSIKDVSFHCKYETLCLCSIIKKVVMMEQPYN